MPKKKKARVLAQENMFDTRDSLSDLTLEVQRKKLYVHKVILARASPVFKAMLFSEPGSGFQEEKAKGVPLPGKKYDDVVNFLEQIYAESSHKPITDGTLVGIMALADEYLVEYVLKKCQQYIEGQLQNPRNLSAAVLLMYLWICKRYPHRMQHLENGIVTKIAGLNIEAVQGSDYYSQLSKDEQSELVLKRCLELERTKRSY